MRIGIDLGGTKIEGILLDETGREQRRLRIDTPKAGYPSILEALVGLVRLLEGDSIAKVGVGLPGAISPATGLVKNANTTALIGHPLDRDLARLLGRPIRVANDANCFALSEATDGSGAAAACVFGVILGTGTGGGVVLNKHPLTGPHAIAGEWGHNPLPWPRDDERPGPACYCGKRGCIETFLSGPGLAHDHRRVTGQALTPRELDVRAEEGDPLAGATWDRYLDRLARALAGVINILDPDCVVLGGGLSNVGRLYRALPGRLPAYVFSDEVHTPIVPAKHGDSSGVRGAAWLWPG